MTLPELVDTLRGEEETVLIDLLGLHSDEIVDAFIDLIKDKYEYLSGQYEEKD